MVLLWSYLTRQGNMLYAVPLANNTTQAQVVHVTLTGG